ncbi:transposase, partial [Klebsiella pneumoniae]|uniref:transposase n=1 Tax=Klebsiella pneumoniae TaxID=573 RepID=UPI003A8587AE
MLNIKILEKQLAYIKEQIAKVDRQMYSLIRSEKKLSGIYDIIVSINGVGPVTAIALIVLTSGFTTFDSKRSLACFLGIAPFRSESGTSIQNGSHRSRQADSYYSGLLYMVAVSA